MNVHILYVLEDKTSKKKIRLSVCLSVWFTVWLQRKIELNGTIASNIFQRSRASTARNSDKLPTNNYSMSRECTRENELYWVCT